MHTKLLLYNMYVYFMHVYVHLPAQLHVYASYHKNEKWKIFTYEEAYIVWNFMSQHVVL